MRIFLSWSGERSKYVAEQLSDWLPVVIQETETFMSEHDIEAGSRWSKEIDEKLDRTDFGILLVTPENQYEPWLVHEAGALGKSVEESRVVPLLIDMEPSDLDWPLARFQAVRLEEEGIRELISSLNDSLGEEQLEGGVLQKSFSAHWSGLEEKIGDIPDPPQQDSSSEENDWAEVQRRQEEKVSEVLELVRGISRRHDRGLYLKATGDIKAFAENLDRDVLFVEGDVYTGGDISAGPSALFRGVEAFCSSLGPEK